jgi:RimJ/RimL family protein N-acetyltransferase
VPDFTDLVTERLHLSAMSLADTDELFGILSDPAGWWFDPDSRHVDRATTLGFAERAAARWPTDGLSYWTARRRSDGVIIGLGGVQRHRSGSWNVSYRIAAAAQGQGLAVELARAGIDAAGQIDPGVAVIAWVVEHNAPSRRVAERLGLIDQGPRLDANDGVVRLAYADRALPPD